MSNENNHDLLAAMNTLTAGRWEMFKARLFGDRIFVIDAVGMKVTHIHYKGKVYFAGYEDTKAT